jgi:hypothetical protein
MLFCVHFRRLVIIIIIIWKQKVFVFRLGGMKFGRCLVLSEDEGFLTSLFVTFLGVLGEVWHDVEMRLIVTWETRMNSTVIIEFMHPLPFLASRRMWVLYPRETVSEEWTYQMFYCLPSNNSRGQLVTFNDLFFPLSNMYAILSFPLCLSFEICCYSRLNSRQIDIYKNMNQTGRLPLKL